MYLIGVLTSNSGIVHLYNSFPGPFSQNFIISISCNFFIKQVFWDTRRYLHSLMKEAPVLWSDKTGQIPEETHDYADLAGKL